MKATPIVGALLALLLAMAGCTGSFDIDQTEPIRIQVDGDGEDARLSADDDGSNDGGVDSVQSTRKQEFRIATTDDVDAVKVVVIVKNVAVAGDGADDDGQGDDGGDDNDTSNDTSDNATSTSKAVVLVIIEDRTTGESLAEETVEAGDEDGNAELNVNVKGKDNVVIVTQAVEGVADVNVAAQSGESTMDSSDETVTATTTTSTAATTSSSEPAPTTTTTTSYSSDP